MFPIPGTKWFVGAVVFLLLVGAALGQLVLWLWSALVVPVLRAMVA